MGHQEGRRVFWEWPKFFELGPIVLNDVQRIFPRGGEKFSMGLFPSCAPLVTGLRLREYCEKNKRHRWDICEELSVWHFVTKSTGLKSVKPRMLRHFSESRDPSYVGSAMCSECPRKDRRSKSFGLQSTSTGKRASGLQRTRLRDYISDLAWSRLGVDPAELSEIAVDCEVFRTAILPKEKLGKKWLNDYAGLHWNILLMKLSLFCLPKVNVAFK